MNARSELWTYWQTLVGLLQGRRTLMRNLDIPLDAGIRRAKYASLWSALSCFAAFLIRHQGATTPSHARVGWLAAGWLQPILSLSACAITVVISYGFLRLYTLVSHVLTINLFKTRGQRLRLLNEQTTILSLAPVLALGYAIGRWNPFCSDAVVGAVMLYALYLFGNAYNLVFHKVKWHGFTLFVGSTLVTWFVLAIGALAISVALGVIGFFILIVLRLVSNR